MDIYGIDIYGKYRKYRISLIFSKISRYFPTLGPGGFERGPTGRTSPLATGLRGGHMPLHLVPAAKNGNNRDAVMLTVVCVCNLGQ